MLVADGDCLALARSSVTRGDCMVQGRFSSGGG